VLVVDDEDFFPCDISDEADALLQQAIKVGRTGSWRSTATCCIHLEKALSPILPSDVPCAGSCVDCVQLCKERLASKASLSAYQLEELVAVAAEKAPISNKVHSHPDIE
jgi:hypothetical protein